MIRPPCLRPLKLRAPPPHPPPPPPPPAPPAPGPRCPGGRAEGRGRGLGAVQADVQRRLRATQMPLEYHAEVVRPSEDEEASLGAFVSYAVAAAVGAFLLLQAAFGSWRLATLLFVTLPVAVVGGLVVVALDGGDLSLGAAA